MNGTAFGHLRDRHRSALRAMHIALWVLLDRLCQRLGGHLIVCFNHGQFCSAGIEFGRVTFVFVDMRGDRAKDRLPRLGIASQRERIGSGAGCDQIDRGLGCLERGADRVTDFVHDRIIAIGHRVAAVRLRQTVHGLGMDRARVVRSKKHQVGSSMMWSSHSSNGVSNSETVLF